VVEVEPGLHQVDLQQIEPIDLRHQEVGQVDLLDPARED
jgi:hypothetical protein